MSRREVRERVELGERSYEIIIGPGTLPLAGRRIAKSGRKVLLVSDRRVYGLYGETLTKSLDEAGVVWHKKLLAAGESRKNMAAVGQVHDRLLQGRYGRDAVVIALGGGIIGDIAGFAAATYMRGVGVVQIPTTLLSQVDSSVGGKTGVNHPLGKNMIGAFHQPSLVIADTAALATLPNDEIRCGVAEIIKYGLIASRTFFAYLEKDVERITELDERAIAHAVRTSCRIKAQVVADDERESGRRAILNFGHTVAHAIEAVTRYRRFTHGYAVAIGMVAAAWLSHLKGTLDKGDVSRIIEVLSRAGLPVTIPSDIGDTELISAMAHDKKTACGVVRFALLQGVGQCLIRSDVTRSEIREALCRCR